MPPMMKMEHDMQAQGILIYYNDYQNMDNSMSPGRQNSAES